MEANGGIEAMNRRDFLLALPCMPLLLKGSRKRIRYFMPRPRAQWLHSARGRIVFMIGGNRSSGPAPGLAVMRAILERGRNERSD